MGIKRTQEAPNDEKLTSEAVFIFPQSGMSLLLKHYKLADKLDTGANSVSRSLQNTWRGHVSLLHVC